MAGTVPTDSRGMRGSSIWIVLGMLLTCWSLPSGTGSDLLTPRYELNFLLTFVGVGMVIFGSVRKFRRNGDSGDFEDFGKPKVR